MKFIIYLFNLHLKIIYGILKLCKTKNKIVFISRQTDGPSLDMKLLVEEIKKRDKNIEIVLLCKKWKKDFISLVKYYFYLYKHMYHLATSRVCVVDTFIPTVSILKHKKNIKILQIWHSLGAVKKFALQSVGTVSGRNKDVSSSARIHQNYDALISTSKETTKFYSEAFGYPIDKFYDYGLPRIDYMLKQENEVRERIFSKYPELKNKINIVYAPTFRTTLDDNTQKLIDAFDLDKYNLIIKEHYFQKLNFDHSRVFTCDEFLPLEMLTICDYLITDYSAISIEGAVYNNKLLFYLFDYEKYMENNGINMDMFKIMPKYTFKNEKKLYECIEKDNYDIKVLDKFRKDYLPRELGKSTKNIVDLIMKWYSESEKLDNEK